MSLSSSSAYTVRMRLLIVLIALFLLGAPLVFPHTPLPPVADVQEEVEILEEAPEPVVEKEMPAQAVQETKPAPTPKPVAPPPQKPKPEVQKLNAPEGVALAALLESKIALYTNTERTRRGLTALVDNALLAMTSRAHSADMLARDFFEHENPDGCSSSCRATNAGYLWRMIGENLYMLEGFDFSPEETAAMIVSGWMESPGHRANILREGYTETGVGVIVQGSAIYATVLYATPR